MAYCLTVEFVKLHGLTSEKGFPLNGATGRLGRYHKDLGGIIGNDRYCVYVPECVMVKVENLYAVNSRWIKEVRKSPTKGAIQAMMMEFRAPGEHPCPITDLMATDKMENLVRGGIKRNRGGASTCGDTFGRGWTRKECAMAA